MPFKFTSLFKGRGYVDNPWISEQIELQDTVDIMPFVSECNSRFWVEDDKDISVQQGEPFSLTIKRDVAPQKPIFDHIKIKVYKVVSDESNVEATHLADDQVGFSSGKTVLFWEGKCSITCDNLSIKAPGDFRIRITAWEWRDEMQGGDIIADFYSEIIHIL
ncbi:hypothetical protein F4813DRAFT_396247 [Daldinia decipiens]|uniref:uncharacterized protein n=1 Tax=Daldinia decipiens TaxID=326647 RepID=UPI0020C31232|nr:uncharacterized protein F4813DRAFT_396247 [Daldinia decipiens]KAI1657750.1 hypothetical protein F4813DRAFT_396247 [Daldinia decipiens]